MIQSIIEKYKDRIAVGTKNFINITWIEQTEKKLGFPLPDSYKEMLLNYEFITVWGIDFKTIAPPEYQEDADIDINYTYQVNLQNNLFQKDELAFLEMDEETYYFKIEEAGQTNEYPVYIRDYITNENNLYANNFQEFLELFLVRYSNSNFIIIKKLQDFIIYYSAFRNIWVFSFLLSYLSRKTNYKLLIWINH